MPQDKNVFDDPDFNKDELKRTPENGFGCSNNPPPQIDDTCKPIKNVGITDEEQRAYLASRPYKAEKSILHNGKMAKPGHTFLKVRVNWKDRKYTNAREFPTEGLMIDGEINLGILNHLYDKLYEEVKAHHQSVVHGKPKK